jgi:hypothetical protein
VTTFDLFNGGKTKSRFCETVEEQKNEDSTKTGKNSFDFSIMPLWSSLLSIWQSQQQHIFIFEQKNR